MTNSEAATRIRKYVNEPHGCYSWATYDCSNEQHYKFVEYYHKWFKNYKGTGNNYNDTKNEFALEYADKLERGEV